MDTKVLEIYQKVDELAAIYGWEEFPLDPLTNLDTVLNSTLLEYDMLILQSKNDTTGKISPMMLTKDMIVEDNDIEFQDGATFCHRC